MGLRFRVIFMQPIKMREENPGILAGGTAKSKAGSPSNSLFSFWRILGLLEKPCMFFFSVGSRDTRGGVWLESKTETVRSSGCHSVRCFSDASSILQPDLVFPGLDYSLKYSFLQRMRKVCFPPI